MQKHKRRTRATGDVARELQCQATADLRSAITTHVAQLLSHGRRQSDTDTLCNNKGRLQPAAREPISTGT